jgi:hypothetical protein
VPRGARGIAGSAGEDTQSDCKEPMYVSPPAMRAIRPSAERAISANAPS